MEVSSLCFLFASMSELGAEEAYNLLTPIDANEKALGKACFFYTKV